MKLKSLKRLSTEEYRKVKAISSKDIKKALEDGIKDRDAMEEQIKIMSRIPGTYT